MRFYISFFWFLVIAVLHAIPGQDLDSLHLDDFFQLDKLVHVIIFLIGVVLSSGPAQKRYPVQWKLIVVFFYLFYGLFLEILQGLFFQGRFADLLDWTADAIGVFLGLWIYNKLPFIRIK